MALLCIWWYEHNLEFVNWLNWMIIDAYMMFWLLYNMNLLFFVRIGVLWIEIGASNELLWRKHRCCLLQQCDEHHEHKELLVMRLEWLTVVSRVTGRPSWSLGGISLVDHHRGDGLWRGWVTGWVMVVTKVTT